MPSAAWWLTLRLGAKNQCFSLKLLLSGCLNHSNREVTKAACQLLPVLPLYVPGLPTATYAQPSLSSPANQPQSVWFTTLSPRLQGLTFSPPEQSFSHLVQECPVAQKPGPGIKSDASMSCTVTQQFRALVALAVDLDSIPSTPIAAHNCF